MDADHPSKIAIPESFRPLLWWVKWEELDADKHKETIIVAIINEGTLAQWRWLIRTYGMDTIHMVLSRRLATEFHPESRNLAQIIFSIPQFRHAR